MAKIPEKRGQSFYTSSQSFKIMFFVLWLKNFGDFNFILSGWFIKMSVQKFQPLIVIYRRIILCIIIGEWDVHQFIGLCLIPLDPCIVTGLLIIKNVKTTQKNYQKYCIKRSYQPEC